MTFRPAFALCLIAGFVALAAPRPAFSDAMELVKSVPPHLAEATSGGVWNDAGKTGIYRVMTFVVPVEKTSASHVVVQWLALEEGSDVPVVVQTIPIKEVNDQNLQGAFIALETEKDNEATLIVSSYDPIEDNDISINVRLTAPGKYALAKQ